MVVRMRRNRSQTAKRRSHHAISATQVSSCASCGAIKQSHRACPGCGKYRGRVVIDVVAKKARATKRVARKTKALEASGKIKK